MREILKEQKRLLAAWLIAEFFCALLTVGMSLFMKQMSDTAYGTRGLQGVRELMWFGICLADLPGRVSAGLQSFSEKENIRADCPAGYL